MLIAIAGFLFVTFLFGCLGICIAKEVKGHQKVWAWLFVLAGWAAIVAYLSHIVGFWGKPFDPTTPFPDRFMVPFCVLFFTFPLTLPLIMGICEIWREGGRNPNFMPSFFDDDETGIGILYVVSLGLSFYLTDRFGVHYGWSFPISLFLLVILFLLIASFVSIVCWLTTKLAQRFSPASKSARKIETK